MKTTKQTVLIVAVLAAVLLSACGAVAAAPGAAKVRAEPIEFTGVIESILGSTWVIGGKTVTVDPAILGGASFFVGDSVEVEGTASLDGTVTASVVKLEDAEDENANDDNSNDANSNDSDDGNVNDSDDANANDDNSNEADGGTDDNSNDDTGSADDDSSSGSNSNGG
jgi:hypothetical protein